jgi:uncharacterized protein YllA (UPF0747 family)
MSLTETRMVLFEKIEDYERGSVNIILGHIDSLIYLAINNNENEISLRYKYFNNKYIIKILKQNGYKLKQFGGFSNPGLIINWD